MGSLTRWTWVWVNSRSWWWTGRPGVLQFMGSQRVGHDSATELNWMSVSLQFLEEQKLWISCYFSLLQVSGMVPDTLVLIKWIKVDVIRGDPPLGLLLVVCLHLHSSYSPSSLPVSTYEAQCYRWRLLMWCVSFLTHSTTEKESRNKPSLPRISFQLPLGIKMEVYVAVWSEGEEFHAKHY